MIPGGVIQSPRLTNYLAHPPEEPHIPPFNIYHTDTAFLIWDVEVILQLREQLGIVGELVGTLPRKPRQNRAHGLPLEILKEEAVLLQHSGRAAIVELGGSPTARSEQLYCKLLSASYHEQNQYLLSSIYAKSQKFVENPAKHPAHLDLTGEVDIANPPYHLQRLFEREVSDFWQADYTALQSVELTAAEKRRLAVVRDLCRRKYKITSGSKFGGDFLVYPGDPLVYHAYFVVRVFAGEMEVNAAELLALSRLASSVKKVAVAALVSGTVVRYISIQWSGLK